MVELERIANLLKEVNRINFEISKIIGRPALPQHIGEFISSKIFHIKLETSATTKGIDGYFLEGSLKGKTVNIKIYGKQEVILDISLGNLADYYLVLTGPKSQPVTSKGSSRPLIISCVYLFKMKNLIDELQNRGVKIGIATSIAQHYWVAAEIYPHNTNKEMELNTEQIRQLKLFDMNYLSLR